MKKLFIFSLLLLAMSAAAQDPFLRGPGTTNTPSDWTNIVRALTGSAGQFRTNQFTTNVVGQPVIGKVTFGAASTLPDIFQVRSPSNTLSIDFGDQVQQDRFSFEAPSADTTALWVRSTNESVVLLRADNSPGTNVGFRFASSQTDNRITFSVLPFLLLDGLSVEFMRVNQFSGVEHLRSTNTITLRAPTVIATNNLVARGAFLGKVGLATNSAGATVDSLSGSLANFQTNQFTTNVVGQPVLGRILLGSTGSIGADFQLRSTNTTTSVSFGDQALEDRIRIRSLINAGNTTLDINASNNSVLTLNASMSPGTGGIMSLATLPTINSLGFNVNPFKIYDTTSGFEFARFNVFGGLEHLTSTNAITLRAPTVTVTNNLNVGGTLNTATMNVTNMVLVNLSNNYAYVSGNGTLTTTNNGAGWTNIQSGNIVSNGTLLTMTALGFDSPTNLWVANTSFGLGTNYTAVQAAGTVGITGLLNRSSNTERYGQLVMLATGTVTFTNAAGIKCNDGVLTRTITNGNSATIAIDYVPGVVTNLFIVQTW